MEESLFRKASKTTLKSFQEMSQTEQEVIIKELKLEESINALGGKVFFKGWSKLIQTL